MSNNADALPEIARKVAGCLPGRAAVRLLPRPALEHQSNNLYDGFAGDLHFIVKEYLRPDELADAPRREFGALAKVASLDIAPRPIANLPAGNAHGPLVVYEFMPGEMWDRRPPTESGLADLAAVWLKMNAVPLDSMWISRGYDEPITQTAARIRDKLHTYAAWVQAAFPAGQFAADTLLELLVARQSVIDALAVSVPVDCFCRGDSRFANVIQRPDGRLALVDWEDSGRRDPARDLADVLTHANQEDTVQPDAWRAFLDPYLAERTRLDHDLPRRLHHYLGLFPIWWLSVLLGFGMRRAAERQLAGWRINTMSPSQRLRRYLARAQAWPAGNFERCLEDLQGVTFFPEG